MDQAARESCIFCKTALDKITDYIEGSHGEPNMNEVMEGLSKHYNISLIELHHQLKKHGEDRHGMESLNLIDLGPKARFLI